MPGELYQIYANKTAINNKRATLADKTGFGDSPYWSSIENNSNLEYTVYFDHGDIGYEAKNWHCAVLAFLALEY